MHRFVVGFIGFAAGLGLVAAALGDEKKPTEIKGWGTVIDPDGDCSITEDKGKVTIKVPGSHHDLYVRKLNAPRVLREVEGDFVAQVKVTADWKPGARLPKVSTVPYNGAGLLVWDSEKHFVRWERSVMIHGTPDMPRYRSYTTPLENKDAGNCRGRRPRTRSSSRVVRRGCGLSGWATS